MPVLRIGTSIKVGTGSGTLFWLDRWAGSRPFAERFHALFVICVRPQLPMAVALTTRENPSSSACFKPISSAGYRATSKVLQLKISSSVG